MNKREKLGLNDLFAFINKWQAQFIKLQQEIDELKDKLIEANHPGFWLTALSRMLGDYHETLLLYYPYLSYQSLPEAWRQIHHLSNKDLLKTYKHILRGHHPEIQEGLIPYLKKAVKNIVLFRFRVKRVNNELAKIAYGMDFKPLFDQQKRLFSIGFNMSEQKIG